MAFDRLGDLQEARTAYLAGTSAHADSLSRS